MKPIDYTKFNSTGEAEAQTNKRWWLGDKKDRAHNVGTVVRHLAQYDSARQGQYQVSARLYGNAGIPGNNSLNRSRAQANSAKTSKLGVMSYNVVQSSIDTITAKISKNKPKPLFLTSGGDYKMQRKAKKLDKFVDGVLYENDGYKLGPLVFRDGAIIGDGLVHVYEHYGRVKLERVLASELYVDPLEALYGKPRQLHRVKNVDRQVLVDLFPEHEKEILAANEASADLSGTNQNVSDQVTVIESWHLPSGPEATDGLHTINIEEANLDEEKWVVDFFPFAKMPWCPGQTGYWSQGGAEQIQPIQLELNKILYVEQRSFHLAGTFKILRQIGSKTVTEHFNNEVGTIIDYVGVKPEYVVPPVLPPGYAERKQFLINAAFEQLGVSQLSASSQKPAGLNSGKALREFNDIESDRFMTIGQAYEQLFLELARLIVWTAKGIYGRTKKLTVKVPGKKFIETIDWKDVDLDEDDFIMKIFPVSSLPNDPAGRLQTIQEYIQAGMIDPITGKRLLDFPDLEQHETLDNAQEDWINEVLEKIVDEGEYTPPDPNMKLDLAKWFCLMYYAQGQTNGLEEDRLELLRTWNSQLDLLTQKAMPPAPPAPGPQGPGGQPQAVPMAPPQSDMIPNVPAGAA